MKCQKVEASCLTMNPWKTLIMRRNRQERSRLMRKKPFKILSVGKIEPRKALRMTTVNNM